ncbi:MAG: nitrile hydratase subunit alpha, partial [Pseudomonadota bacterium]
MPHDHHEHMSPSGHPFQPDNDVPLTHWQVMEIAVRELMVEKGIATASEINAEIER